MTLTRFTQSLSELLGPEMLTALFDSQKLWASPLQGSSWKQNRDQKATIFIQRISCLKWELLIERTRKIIGRNAVQSVLMPERSNSHWEVPSVLQWPTMLVQYHTGSTRYKQISISVYTNSSDRPRSESRSGSLLDLIWSFFLNLN